MRRIIAGTLALTLLGSTWLLGSEAQGKKKVAKKAGPNVSEQLQQMKDQLNGQQQQINQLQQQLQQSNQQLQQAQQQLQSGVSAASQQAQTAAQQAAAAQDTASSLNSQVADLKTSEASTVTLVQATQKRVNYLEAPASMAYKGVKLTPGGFLELAMFGDSRNLGTSSVATPWNNIPLNGSSNSHIPMFRETAQQSRFSLRADGKVNDKIKLTGFWEADFMGAAPSANENETNSFNLRERQMWGRVETASGWAVTAGQQWSLMTPNRKGVSNLTEYLPAVLDGQFVVGYNWARLPSLRFAKSSGAMSVAVSIDNPSTIVTGVFPASFPTGTEVLGLANSVNALSPVTNMLPSFSGVAVPTGIGQNASVTALGTTNGQLAAASCTSVTGTPSTTVTPVSCANLGGTTASIAAGSAANVAPDIAAKIAWDSKRGHFELKAIGTFGRDRILVPTVPGAIGSLSAAQFQAGDSTTSFGGGAGVGLIIPVTKKADFIFQGMGGLGTGRYLAGTLGSTDWTYNSKGELTPIKSEGTMVGLEMHPSPKLDWYVYAGQEYYQRQVEYVLSAANIGVTGTAAKQSVSAVGYGTPTTSYATCANEGAVQCSANNRALLEGTSGLTYRWYRGSYGTFQTGVQYAYAYRATWTGTGLAGQTPSQTISLASTFPVTLTGTGIHPKGYENIGNITFRYILP